MTLLALDLATKTGWAVAHLVDRVPLTAQLRYNPEAHKEPIIDSGAWKLGGVSLNECVVELWHRIHDVGSKHKVTHIAVELPFAGARGNAIMKLGPLHGVARLVCGLQKLPFYAYEPSMIKRYATGNGSAKKFDMVDAGERRGWTKGLGEDEVDARWIALMAVDRIAGQKAKR